MPGLFEQSFGMEAIAFLSQPVHKIYGSSEYGWSGTPIANARRHGS
jgi:hypothetical protein